MRKQADNLLTHFIEVIYLYLIIFLSAEFMNTRIPRSGSWNGKINGVPQQIRVFVWILDYQFEGEDKKEEKGAVTIIQ